MLMGQSRQVSMGPNSIVSIMTGLIVNEAPDGVDSLQYVQLFSFLIGVLLLILGTLRFALRCVLRSCSGVFFNESTVSSHRNQQRRLGFLDVVLSRPLLSGFVNAVALKIVIEQIDAMFGMANRNIHGYMFCVPISVCFCVSRLAPFTAGKSLFMFSSTRTRFGR